MEKILEDSYTSPKLAKQKYLKLNSQCNLDQKGSTQLWKV